MSFHQEAILLECKFFLLGEFTNNAIERNLAVNWVPRFSSSVGSLTVGCHKNIQSEGRRGKFSRTEEVSSIGEGGEWTKKRGGGFVSRTESNFSVDFPGLRMAKHGKDSLTSGEFSEKGNSVTQLTLSDGEGTVPMAVFSNFEFYTIFRQILVHPISPLSLFKISPLFSEPM